MLVSRLRHLPGRGPWGLGIQAVQGISGLGLTVPSDLTFLWRSQEIHPAHRHFHPTNHHQQPSFRLPAPARHRVVHPTQHCILLRHGDFILSLCLRLMPSVPILSRALPAGHVHALLWQESTKLKFRFLTRWKSSRVR